MAKTVDKWQFGDFQTPDKLARLVVGVLKKNHGIAPATVIEPTCGKGAFVRAASEGFSGAEIIGYDVNPDYIDEAIQSLPEEGRKKVTLHQGDFFLLNWNEVLVNCSSPLLVIGNPPWVTSSELGMLNSANLPEKTNFQGRRGIEAITGSGNFDISEWMILQHVDWLAKKDGAIAFLCKYSVARKVMRKVRESDVHRFFGHIYRIDAKQHFSASVEACLFVLTTEKGNADCEVYESIDSDKPKHVIGARDGFVVRDVEKYERRRNLRGQDLAYIWRSGVKHDCSKVMELGVEGDHYINGYGDLVDIEEDFVFPLLKSSDIGNSRVSIFRKAVIVPQRQVGECTKYIGDTAPRTWDYLRKYEDLLNARKSSIYKGKPEFSIFGVGDYTFKKYKIAISGLYKRLNFCLVSPIRGKAVVFDDTVNFLGFDRIEEAEFVLWLLHSEPAREFYEANIFWDEKRPITTEILRRLCIKSVAKDLGKEVEYMEFIEASSRSRMGQLELGIAENPGKYRTKSKIEMT